MKIIVDADATPKNALEICRRAAADYSIPLITVASFNHRIESDRHVVVGNAPQEADTQVINLTNRAGLPERYHLFSPGGERIKGKVPERRGQDKRPEKKNRRGRPEL